MQSVLLDGLMLVRAAKHRCGNGGSVAGHDRYAPPAGCRQNFRCI